MKPLFQCFALTLLLSASVTRADDKPAEPAPTEAQVKEQIARLDPKQPDDVRMEVLKWLRRNHEADAVIIAIPAIEECIRKDTLSDLRDRAVYLRFQIAQMRKEPCPLVVAEAALDSDELVRQTALALADQVATFAPGCVEVYLKCAESGNRDLRTNSLMCLATAGRSDKRVLAALEKAKRDKDFGVRHNAHVAMFRANDDLLEFLTYLLRLQEDKDGVVGPFDATTEEGKQTQTTYELAQLGSALLFIEWAERRPEEMAAALYKLTSDKSPTIRRGAARIIGASALMEDRNKAIEKESKDQAKPQSPQPDIRPTKAAFELKKLKAGDKLRELRDKDPDMNVRREATLAIERFGELEKDTKP